MVLQVLDLLNATNLSRARLVSDSSWVGPARLEMIQSVRCVLQLPGSLMPLYC